MIDSRIRSALGQLIHKCGESARPTMLVPDAALPLRLLVADGHLVGLDCGSALCVRGLAHDLQALLVASAAATDPAPVPATAQLIERSRGPMRSPVAEAVAVCEAAVARDVAVPHAWIDLHAQMVLGPGPDPGERIILGHHEWRAVRLLLLGGLPAVAAGNAWHLAAQVLRSRSVVVAGTENCPALTRRPAADALSAPAPPLWPIRVPGATLAGQDETPVYRGAAAVEGALRGELAEVRRQAATEAVEAPSGGELAEIRRQATAAAVAAPMAGQPAVGTDVLRRIIDRLKKL
ncbi:hypothetical protein AB0H83_49750 [Dactylosporangium sp. NPDC050688]|uniref:hypothetical protein n=1 Tax=Dactylosporangium sp. NPDC050688 TaxID=3157217 RepID=UPI0033FB5486